MEDIKKNAPGTESEYLIEVKNLVKWFPIKSSFFRRTIGNVRAVDGISFHIKRGQTMGLVGESGCGKSTAGRTILRLIEKTSGEVIFDGQDIFKMSREELRAYMDEHLKAYLGVEKVIWVKEGIDPEETNGHIDDVATFIAPGVMVCIWTDDEDYPFYRQCHEAYETLSNATDAKGRALKVYKLPMPAKPLYMDQASCDTIDMDENAEPRVADEPLIASYMNIHCITQQEPKA